MAGLDLAWSWQIWKIIIIYLDEIEQNILFCPYLLFVDHRTMHYHKLIQNIFTKSLQIFNFDLKFAKDYKKRHKFCVVLEVRQSQSHFQAATQSHFIQVLQWPFLKIEFEIWLHFMYFLSIFWDTFKPSLSAH